jgi:hypothetical protein
VVNKHTSSKHPTCDSVASQRQQPAVESPVFDSFSHVYSLRVRDLVQLRSLIKIPEKPQYLDLIYLN